jgi:transcriptional regulator with XRE-family HTH domain
MALLRRVLGDTLRGQRLRQQRTLREVSSAARVSLGYLSEVERGQKEASSELLASICEALEVQLADVLGEVSETMRGAEIPASTGQAAERVHASVGAALPRTDTMDRLDKVIIGPIHDSQDRRVTAAA